ncbi:MAG: site-specific integrase [Hydrogenophaga sp.]|uniref:site-specific integrase n=1 Tax=Hydrogenophaga sp. TaxID=1904254 RepID=UPI0027520309|nr:site-specific integrase [Hydrogenophaga sp.]MDP2430560.1 site-specific integrase [Pseudomonadota bacterium]MDZ4174658.1 site-specific integrase [Hydrogenophaga sp.]
MLDHFFKLPSQIACYSNGPGGELLNEFARYLSESGYSRSQGARHLRSAAHLMFWADGQGIPVTDVGEITLDCFAGHLHECRCQGFTGMYPDKLTRGARAFVVHRRRLQAVSAGECSSDAAPSGLWEQFCQWMQQRRGTSERTLQGYRDYLRTFLAGVENDLEQIDASYLRQFILERGRSCGLARAKATTSALRMFIRFLIAQGKCPADLDASIPSLAYWRLSTLPRYLQQDEVERVISSPHPDTPVGKRDRAILLLLSRLGLRAGDVLNLRLTDIDWYAATICVCGKNQRQAQLPLTQEVGDAIVDYLQHGRPRTDSDYIFVRSLAPFRRFRDTRAISDVAKLAMRRAGVDLPVRGAAHVLRHSVATSMLRQGASLQDISVILRHQSINSTLIYAKVDVIALGEIAQPWPEVSSC